MIDIIEVLENFGLNADPFGKCTEDEVFRGKKYAACLNILAQWLRRGEMAALVGTAGSGKTTLINDLIARCADQGMIVVRVGHPDRAHVNCACVYQSVAAALPEYGLKFSHSRQLKFLEFAELLGSQLAGRRVAIIIDEAHRLTCEFMRSMKEFSEVSWGVRTDLLGVLFAGLPEFKTKTRKYAPDIHGRLMVGRRIIEAGEIMRSEIREYVKHRARLAGNARLFSEDGLTAMSLVASTPLKANAAAWDAMDYAFMDGAKVVRGEHVAACYSTAEKKAALGPECTLDKIAELTGHGVSTCGAAVNGKYEGREEVVESVDDVLTRALAAGGIEKIVEKARKAG